MNLISEKAIEADVKNIILEQMLIIPAIILFLSLSILAYTTYMTSAPVKLGVEFRGGTAIAFDSTKTIDQLEAEFKGCPLVEVREYGGGKRKLMEFGPMDMSSKDELAKEVKSEFTNIEINDIGEQFSKTLQGQAVRAVIISFIFMAIVVFIIFRTFVPSGAVLISAFADIVFAMAMMDVFGIPLSLGTVGTVAALLMLICYSVDTDILLTTRLLKRKGELNDKIKGAMKTGLTMITTTLAALAALFFVSSGSYLVSSFTRIDIIRDISVVLIFGLIADIINIRMNNVGILRWYLEKGTERIEKRIERPKKKRHAA